MVVRTLARPLVRALDRLMTGLPLPGFDVSMLTGTLDSRVTFTRAGTAWGYDSEGVLTSYATNAPRFDHDPATRALKGLRIEPAATNLLTYSSEFDNAAWTKTRATVTANATTAPDGNAAADKLVEDSSLANTHRVAGAVALSTATAYTFSLFLKAGERTAAIVCLHITSAGNAFGTQPAVTVDLATGALSGASASVSSSGSLNVGNGWWRVWLTATTTSALTQNPGVLLVDGGGAASYDGNGTSGVYLWGAQLETGAVVTSPIPTTAASVTRPSDVCTVTPANLGYNATEGTLLVEAVTAPGAGNHTYLCVENGSGNQYRLARTIALAPQLLAISGGVTTASVSPAGTVENNTAYRLGLAYALDNYAGAVNGALATDPSGALPVGIVGARIGSRNSNNDVCAGWIRRVAYWPQRLTNAQLQALTL